MKEVAMNNNQVKNPKTEVPTGTNLNDKDYIDLKLKIKNHYVVIIDNKNDIFETVYINDVLYSDDIKKIILNVDQLSIKISNLFSISNSFRFITGCYKEFNIDFLSDRYSFVVLDTNEYNAYIIDSIEKLKQNI